MAFLTGSRTILIILLDYNYWKVPYVRMDMIYGKYITELGCLGLYTIRYIPFVYYHIFTLDSDWFIVGLLIE